MLDFSHIKQGYTLEEILEKYSNDEYNAELLLQHCLKLLTEKED